MSETNRTYEIRVRTRRFHIIVNVRLNRPAQIVSWAEDQIQALTVVTPGVVGTTNGRYLVEYDPTTGTPLSLSERASGFRLLPARRQAA